VSALVDKNTKLTNEANDNAILIESMNRNLYMVVDRESIAARDKQVLKEQLKETEKRIEELTTELNKIKKINENKHNQLLDLIDWNNK
jgi:rubrerythrin